MLGVLSQLSRVQKAMLVVGVVFLLLSFVGLALLVTRASPKERLEYAMPEETLYPRKIGPGTELPISSPTPVAVPATASIWREPVFSMIIGLGVLLAVIFIAWRVRER